MTHAALKDLPAVSEAVRLLNESGYHDAADELSAALDTAPEEESRAITALKVTLFEVDCYLPASIAKSVQKACDTARQHEIRDHEHQHSCSYYCDRPECVKAQRDELREAYVVRQSEGMVEEFVSVGYVFTDSTGVPPIKLGALQGNGQLLPNGTGLFVRLAAAPADAGEGK